MVYTHMHVYIYRYINPKVLGGPFISSDGLLIVTSSEQSIA